MLTYRKGYMAFPEPLNRYIVPPGLRDRSGIIGALLLAKQDYEEKLKGDKG